MDLIEGVGESSSPPRSFAGFSGYEIANDVYNRLVEIGNQEVTSNPEFREQLEAHFVRLPARYIRISQSVSILQKFVMFHYFIDYKVIKMIKLCNYLLGIRICQFEPILQKFVMFTGYNDD